MSQPASIEAQLFAMFRPDYVPTETFASRVDEIGARMGRDASPGAVRIHDARALQAEALRDPAQSEARFFDERGFVLLDHESAVVDWDADPAAPDPSHDAMKFLPEAEALCERRGLSRA